MDLDDLLALSKEERASLKSLDLSWNRMGTIGAEALAPAIKECTSLQGLILGGNQIGPKGASALAPVLPKSLRTLNLRSNKIGDEGASALAQVLPKSLLILNLDNNNIFDAGIMAFVRTWPTCQISVDGNIVSYSAVCALRTAHEQASFRLVILAFIASGLITKTSPAFTFLMRDGDGAVMNRILKMLC